MKRTASVLVLAAVSVAVVACDSAQTRENDALRKNQDNLINTIPIPVLDYSLERDIVVQMYSLRQQARNTWSVITSDGTGTPMFDCPSVGFPIANDTRLVKPEGGDGPRPEPNGLYPASSSWGTWVLCVNDDGSLNPIYNEMDTLTFPFPVTVDYATGKVTKAGDSTMTVTLADSVQP